MRKITYNCGCRITEKGIDLCVLHMAVFEIAQDEMKFGLSQDKYLQVVRALNNEQLERIALGGRTKMKIYRISQDVNPGYDTYSDAVVCAKDKNEAKLIHPMGLMNDWDGKEDSGAWCTAKHVKVEYIGKAKPGLKKGVICASYHAG